MILFWHADNNAITSMPDRMLCLISFLFIGLLVSGSPFVAGHIPWILCFAVIIAGDGNFSFFKRLSRCFFLLFLPIVIGVFL